MAKPDDPGAHQEENQAPPPPCGAAPGLPAIDRGRDHAYGTPPPLAWATCASSCLSSVVSPACRSSTFPACHFVMKLATRFSYETPDAVIGDVSECALL